MSSAVKDLQREITQSAKSVTELLRTTKVIAAELGLNDISGWVDAELSGYSDPSTIPEYRRVSGGSLQVHNPVRGWVFVGSSDLSIPVRQPIGEVESLARAESLFLPLSQENHLPIDAGGMDVSRWAQRISVSPVQMASIASAVRDKLLDWTIELRKRGIVGNDLSFDSTERANAQNQTFNIQNFTGVFGNVSNSTVHIYDYSSIHSSLREQGVPQSERNEIENILDELKKAPIEIKPTLVQRGKDWIIKNQQLLGAAVSIVRKALGIDTEPK